MLTVLQILHSLPQKVFLRTSSRFLRRKLTLSHCAAGPQPPGPSLTTEYTPRERGGPLKPATDASQNASQITSSTSQTSSVHAPVPDSSQPKVEDGPDPSTLPPVTAPPSHPLINPSIPGTLDGRSILEVDIANMAEKPWRRPGSDISDWFNYGFDEISWEAYCFRRREVGDLAGVLKANVLVRATKLYIALVRTTYANVDGEYTAELRWDARRPAHTAPSRDSHHGHGGVDCYDGKWWGWPDDARHEWHDGTGRYEHAGDDGPHDGRDGWRHGYGRRLRASTEPATRARYGRGISTRGTARGDEYEWNGDGPRVRHAGTLLSFCS